MDFLKKPGILLFAGCIFCGLLIHMQIISLRSSGLRKKQNFKIVSGFKSDTAVLTFLFTFFPPLFFCFSYLIFFSLAGHSVGFILVGKGFGKAFRTLVLDERKGRWVVKQDCHGNFPVNVTRFFAIFWVSFTESCSL